jgi:cyclopropane fatty-acyl-phospholipid synthase-like methyltransferase
MSYSFYNKVWFYLLVLCSISLVSIYIYKTKISQHLSNKAEGFSQKENFILKYGNDTNDEFYSNNYEKIHKPKTHLLEQIDLILRTTQTSTEDTILDIGSNTGYVVNELTQRGYNIYGLTSSPQFNNYCKNKYPDAIVITYINCSAEIKALSDIIVTSTNAKKIIEQMFLVLLV